MTYKSNKHLTFKKDDTKSYVYIEENGKDIGILMWNYMKKKWVFEEDKIKWILCKTHSQ